MARPNFLSLGSLDEVAAGTAVSVAHLESWAAMIHGTFVGTASVQISFDGTNWINHPTFTDKTAPMVAAGTMRVKQVRLNCTAYTSGDIAATVSGEDSGA